MKQSHQTRRRCNGAALISALLMAALVTVLGTSLLFSQETWLAQLGHQNERLTTRELAHIGMHWGRAVLYDDRRRGGGDHLGEAWAQTMQPVEVDGAIINGHIIDAQSRFNLNSLVKAGARDPDALASYARLLGILRLPVDLAQSLADWEDADDETGVPGGAENYYYLGLPQPYRAANAPLSDIDELRWVRGYTAEVVARLAPFVTVLPEQATVNVNTASPEVIAAVTGISLVQAQQFAATRIASPIMTSAALASRIPLGEASGRVGISSNFFVIQSVARKGVTRTRIEALVNRQAVRWPTIVWLRQR